MKVAVIGGGISGIGAAWLLSRKYEVHLFEADNRLGGHAHTVDVEDSNGQSLSMDTGFLVYNELTYPHLTQFFRHLDVETVNSDMSLSVQVDSKKLEWSGTDLNSVFGQRKNLIRPGFYKMLFDIMRFGREAEENLALARRHAWTLAELLKTKKYSQNFLTDYLLPIGAAIWSTPEAKMLGFPAETFLSFFINHKLLQVSNRPTWRTVKNGSRQYVQKAASQIGHVHVKSPVLSVLRRDGKIDIQTRTGWAQFDKVILATHAPITAKILKNQSQAEHDVLSAIHYEPNRTVLHSDDRVMPKRKICWSSWNVQGQNNLEHSQKVSLSYYLNRLQPLPTSKDYFVTLNPTRQLSTSIREFQYSHPQFDQKAVRAQRDFSHIQGQGGVYFAGAWFRYGFHEDGLLSAVKVAEILGVRAPWEVA